MSGPLILLEDEPILRQELAAFLGQAGWNVEAVADLSGFRARYDAARHRIAVIDLGLPDGDGMDLIRELRGHGNPLGIVVLTARGAIRDRTAPTTTCRRPPISTKSPPPSRRSLAGSTAGTPGPRPGCSKPPPGDSPRPAMRRFRCPGRISSCCTP